MLLVIIIIIVLLVVVYYLTRPFIGGQSYFGNSEDDNNTSQPDDNDVKNEEKENYTVEELIDAIENNRKVKVNDNENDSLFCSEGDNTCIACLKLSNKIDDICHIQKCAHHENFRSKCDKSI